MDEEYLQEYLAVAPIPLGLIRAIDCRYMAGISFSGKILDAGCGDGLFAKILFKNAPRKIAIGIDRDQSELKFASRLGMHRQLIHCDITRIPVANETFDHAIANSVLEHIVDVNQALSELCRVLKPGGTLVFTVPSEYLSQQFFFSGLFRRIGLPGLARAYARLKHRIWHHEHLDSAEVWIKRLRENRFEVLEFRYIHPRPVTEICDVFVFSGACSLLWRKLFRRLLLCPSKLRGKIMAKFFRTYYFAQEDIGSTLFFVARKQSS